MMTLPCDPWLLAAAPLRRWLPILLGGLLCALVGGLVGYAMARHSASATLRLAPTGDIQPDLLAQWLQSPAFFEQLARRPELQTSPSKLANDVRIQPIPNTDLLQVTVRHSDPAKAVQTADTLARESIERAGELTEGLQIEQTRKLGERLAQVDHELAGAAAELSRLPDVSAVAEPDSTAAGYLDRLTEVRQRRQRLSQELETTGLQLTNLLREISRQDPELIATMKSLAEARRLYTDLHPKVKMLQVALEGIKARVAQQIASLEIPPIGSSPLLDSLYLQIVDLRARRISLQTDLERLDTTLVSLPETALARTQIQRQIQTLEEEREALAQSLTAARVNRHAGSPLTTLRSADLSTLAPAQRLRSAASTARSAGFFGLAAAALLALLIEARDRRIRSAADLMRATGLPLLPPLPELAGLPQTERDRWAFKTLTALRSHLQLAHQESLVCGVISANAGEGRTTWINLLATAAKRQGWPVLTIAAGNGASAGNGVPSAAPETDSPTQWLAKPQEMTEAITGTDGNDSLEIPLPGRVWDPECRGQWRTALQRWRATENLVVLVDLPPACFEESVLLAQHLPHLVWLSGRNQSSTTETREFMQTLQHAGRRPATAALNRASSAPSPKPSRWKQAAAALLIASGLLGNSLAQESADPPAPAEPGQPASAEAPHSFSGLTPGRLAKWQEHLTLGPGDVLNVSIYGQPATLRPGLTIAPDGTITYLQAQDFKAAGLSIDEFRTELEKVLGKFHISPRIIATPVAYRSKKYYMLGNVAQTGVFPLDRPITIFEAIARSGGFVTTFQQRNTLMLADLPRSFLIRSGDDGRFRHVPVDFEALFLQGNLDANVGLAPDDYLYFPPLDLQEVYVLGEVRAPGILAYHSGTTTLRAIVGKGGFLDKAYKSRVLVVRGSLNNPQTFVVNMNDILAARSPDFPLQARDIVYVARRPWAKAEELLERAILSFIRGAVVSWTGQHVGPFITEPVF